MIIMKFQTKQDKNKIAKNTLAIVLAGSFAFSPALAFAAQETTEEENIKKIDLQALSLTEENSAEEHDTVTEETTSTTVVSEETPSEDTQKDAPTLVPGNFFYFTKVALEKIKLALTFNDVKEAELLTTYATERLAEAEVLFSEGKEDMALENIKKALDHFESTETIIESEKESVATSTDEEKENNTSTSDTASAEDENQDDSLVEVEKMVSQNILSLKAAMEKVKNPVAKAALEKNIKKSYAKLEKKLAKLEEKALKFTLTEEKSEDKEVADGQDAGEVDQQTSSSKNGVGVEQDASVSKNEADPETEDAATSNEEPVKAPVQEKTPAQAKKETHEVMKQQQVQIKEEAKEEIKEIKQEVKENRMKQKEEAKQQKKADQPNRLEQESNGKGQDKANKGNEK